MSEEIFLFCDTETTGFPKKGNPIQEGQARVCQIALLLTDAEGKALAEFSALIKPDGWKVGEGAAAIHGFSTEHCANYGMAGRSVFQIYAKLASMADVIVAHNSAFDKQMMEIEQAYFNEGREEPLIVDNDWSCTMLTNTHITGGKWPKLNEALKHYCGRELGDQAHNAMYDVQACRDILFAMRRLSA